MSFDPGGVVGLPTVDAPCFLCNSAEAVPVICGSDPMFGVPGTYTVVRCVSCGFLYQRPRVRDEYLADCYPDNYPQHQEPSLRHPFKGSADRVQAVRWALYTGLGYSAYRQPTPGLFTRLRAQRLLRGLRWYCIPWIGQGRYLDVGCGSGRALALAQALGWQVAGIEMDGPAAEKARRFTDDIYVGDILSAAFEPGRFDVVTAFHVLEHVPDPIAVVRRMLDWLAPAGLLILEVPNAGGLGVRLFGRSWLSLELPRHLSHFTTESLAGALEKAGGHIIWCWHRAKPRDYTRNFRRWLRDRGWNRLARFTERRSVYGILKLFLELTVPVVCWVGRGEVIRIGVVPRRD